MNRSDAVAEGRPDADPAASGRMDQLAARFDAASSAVGLVGPLRRDCALALLVGVMSAVVALLLAAEPVAYLGPFPTAAMLVVLTGQSVVLAVRRVAPVACLAAAVGLQLVVPFLLQPGDMIRGPVTTIAIYTCATRLSPRRTAQLVAGAVLAEGAAIVTASVRPDQAGDPAVPVLVAQLVALVALYGGAALLGAYIATRRRCHGLVGARATEEIEAYRARADAAVARERTRMARELHDIAAHHLSAMVVQAAMVERLVDRDPERARQTAAAVRRQGKETLRDLRAVVGALREPGDPAGGDEPRDPNADSPVPGLAELGRLVETHRQLGTAVTLEIAGLPGDLAPVADVTGYRVVQEALANAREHAPGAPVRVSADQVGDEVVLTVENPLPAGTERASPATSRSGRGFGLAGMRERAQLVGARFEAGPTGSGSWRVRLVLRTHRADAEETT